MSQFEIINRLPFTTTNGKSVVAEATSVVRVAKDGRVMLVRVVRKQGGQTITSTKERPTTSYLRDIKHAVQAAS